MRISDWMSDVCSSDLPAAMQAWLSRVPLTRDFPPDFSATLKGDAPAFVVEMTTLPQCAPCADLWAKLQILRRQYGLNVAVLSREEPISRSARLGLHWVGHPVAVWRATNDHKRVTQN